MSEDSPEQPVRTGVGEIDGVLRDIEELDPQDVASHVAVFERAHEALRRGLDATDDAS